MFPYVSTATPLNSLVLIFFQTHEGLTQSVKEKETCQYIYIYMSYLLCEFFDSRISIVVDAVESIRDRKKIPLANITRKW